MPVHERFLLLVRVQSPMLLIVAGHLRDQLHHLRPGFLFHFFRVATVICVDIFPWYGNVSQVHVLRCRTCADLLCGSFRSLKVVLKAFCRGLKSLIYSSVTRTSGVPCTIQYVRGFHYASRPLRLVRVRQSNVFPSQLRNWVFPCIMVY